MKNDVFEACLAGRATEFFGSHFANAEDRRRAVERAVARPLSVAVADALRVQNARHAPSAARDRNLDSLRSGATAVVTGQQVGLFLGPLFNLYKAASAVSAARALSAETGRPVVPVFWLQSEDHDLLEIANYTTPGPGGAPLTLRLDCPADQRRSIAHLRLPTEVEDRLAELRANVANTPQAVTHLDRLARHYRAGARWVGAFAATLAELFADEGLVLLDPRDDETSDAFTSAAKHIHRRALLGAAHISQVLRARGEQLVVAGFRPAVHVRDGSPLGFFHPEGAEGPRYRLEPRDGGFAEVGGSRVHDLDTLLAVLEEDPRRFSTSVLLRPILQDSLLPTAAYVGGPGEIAYFAQLAPLYAAYGMTMPLVVPRARLRVVDPPTRRRLARHDLGTDDATRPEDEVLAAAARATSHGGRPANAEPTDLRAALLAPFEHTLAGMRGELEHAGRGIDTAVAKTLATVERAVAKLAEKVANAKLQQDRALVEDVRALRASLAPNGIEQERVYGLAAFVARVGERGFLDHVLATISPFESARREVFLEPDLDEETPTKDEANADESGAAEDGPR